MRSRTWTRLGVALTAVVMVSLAAISLSAGENKPLPPLDGPAAQCGPRAGGACGVAMAASKPSCGGQCHRGACPGPCASGDRCKVAKTHLDTALADLDAAVAAAAQAVENGNTDAALARLGQATTLIADTREHLKTPCGPKGSTNAADGRPVNARCPMMGSRLDPEKVPARLTRRIEGQTVGFCCAACPQAWDKLTPAQRSAKLRAATDR